MYLPDALFEVSDKDLHRFVSKRDKTEFLHDYCMTQVTCGVAASPYAANMAVRQNAEDFSLEFPVATKAFKESYEDNGLIGADSIETAICIYMHLTSVSAAAVVHLWWVYFV